jgi:hypothetical protein
MSRNPIVTDAAQVVRFVESSAFAFEAVASASFRAILAYNIVEGFLTREIESNRPTMDVMGVFALKGTHLLCVGD